MTREMKPIFRDNYRPIRGLIIVLIIIVGWFSSKGRSQVTAPIPSISGTPPLRSISVKAPYRSIPYPMKPHTPLYFIDRDPPVLFIEGLQYCGYDNHGPEVPMYIEADPNTLWLDVPERTAGLREVHDISYLPLESPCVKHRGAFRSKLFEGMSHTQTSNRRPLFSFQHQDTLIRGTSFGISRLELSVDSRLLPKHLESVAIKAWHPSWCGSGRCDNDLLVLQPVRPLEPGEYIIWESGNRGPYRIWDFSINEQMQRAR